MSTVVPAVPSNANACAGAWFVISPDTVLPTASDSACASRLLNSEKFRPAFTPPLTRSQAASGANSRRATYSWPGFSVPVMVSASSPLALALIVKTCGPPTSHVSR